MLKAAGAIPRSFLFVEATRASLRAGVHDPHDPLFGFFCVFWGGVRFPENLRGFFCGFFCPSLNVGCPPSQNLGCVLWEGAARKRQQQRSGCRAGPPPWPLPQATVAGCPAGHTCAVQGGASGGRCRVDYVQTAHTDNPALFGPGCGCGPDPRDGGSFVLGNHFYECHCCYLLLFFFTNVASEKCTVTPLITTRRPHLC